MNRYLFALLFFIVAEVYSQQTDYVDFKSVNAQLSIIPENQFISGLLNYKFSILKPVDSIFIDAVNMKFQKVILNGLQIPYSNAKNKLWLKHHFKTNKIYELRFEYEAYPKKAMYFIDWEFEDGNKQIWTQGQGKYTSNWLPSIDDMNDKMEFDLTIEFDKNYDVIANGKLIDKQINTTTTTWHYDMQQPMSSYLVALAIGKYDKKTEISRSGIPLEMYYYPNDFLKFEPTYRYTKHIFDFLESEIGVPYPWQNYKQVPVKDFLYAGMENTSTTIFSDSFLIDSIAFIDKNYVNVNAHELAHQWFGNLVTETSGTHHWLQEGFATYYALLAEKDVFGDDYYYWRLYEYAQELQEQDIAGESTSLLDPKSSSATFYKKGAWVLHVLREHVGDKAFKLAVKKYLLKHQFKNVETTDFISEVEKASGKNLSEFVEIWLESKVFKSERFFEKLKKSTFIKNYLLVNCNENFSDCETKLNSKTLDAIKVKIISDNTKLIKKSTFNNSLKVRQAIAENLTEIPLALKADYESLLNDKSYKTIENALYNLCNNFPEDKQKYLQKTKDIQGFNNKNIRILWLVLILNSTDFEDINMRNYFQELISYTSPEYDFEVRQNTFSYLSAMHIYTETVIVNLINATKHHNWQFKASSKVLLDYLRQDEKYKNLITKLEVKPN